MTSVIVLVLRTVISLFCSLMFSVTGVSQQTVGYTDGEPIIAQKQSYCFDNSGILIGGYYAGKGLAKKAADAGIDFVIDTDIDKEYLDEYEQNNVGVIVASYNLPSFYYDLPEENLNKWLNQNKEEYKDHPAIWGDDMIDEPTAAVFGDINNALTAYRTAHPDKFCLVNLFPAYANDEQLGEKSELTALQKVPICFSDVMIEGIDQYRMHVSDYVNTVDTDYICADIYPYSSDLDKDGNEVKSTYNMYLRNLDILAAACRDTNRDLWVITQAAGETEKGIEGGKPRYCDEVSDISQQVYACLAFGAKAIIHAEFGNKGWWDKDTSHMINAAGEPTATYYAVQSVNNDVKAFSDVYGKYTYTSTYLINRYKVAGHNRGRLETTVYSEQINLESKNALAVGTFTSENDGNAYIVTNMEELNDSVTATFGYTVGENENVTVYQSGEEKTAAAGETLEITLEPGEGVFMTVK